MREDFLHYIWKFKKFDFGKAITVDGLPVVILNGGTANFNSGPDFFNGKIKIGEQVWAGNIEIHIKSSDWYSHQHQEDNNYDNVILHVVWEDDIQVFRKDNTAIPTVELKNLIAGETMQNYRNLLLAPNAKWINCENDFKDFPDFDLENWLERIYLEKLEKKSQSIKELLDTTENNWEAVLFQLLAKNFGLKVNGGALLSMARSIDFKIVQKSGTPLHQLEALFFGQSGLLDKKEEDAYYLKLVQEYKFLKRKFLLNNQGVERPKFFRLRPDNFPNIRVSQLASLYSGSHGLFSKIVKAKTRQELFQIFQVETTEYWKTHYNFNKTHPSRSKKLTDPFIDLLLINTIVPLKFYYSRCMGVGEFSETLNLVNEIKAEKNTVIEKFNMIRPGTAGTALQSQALLHLKQEYCDKNLCLHCNLGTKLIKG